MKGLGLRRSAPHKLARRVDLALHPAVRGLLAAAALPDASDLTPYEPPIFDQGQTGSCTAHATSAGISAAFAAAGAPLGFVPSQRELYATTRAYERGLATPPGQALPVLSDSGAELVDVYHCLAVYGVKAMAEQTTSDGRFSDVEVAHVNDEPAFSDLEAAGQKLVVGPYGVDLTQPGASDVVAAAIVAKIPVGIACYVDSAFMQLQAGQVAGACNQSDPAGGGHAILFDGFRTVNGARQFLLRNSWGIGWGDAGRIWTDASFFAALWEAHPLSVVTGVQ